MAVGLFVCVAGPGTAQDVSYTTGVVINGDGWALVHSDHIAGCTTLDVPGIGNVVDVLEDAPNGVAAIRIASGLLRGGVTIAQDVPDANASVLLLGHRPAARQSDLGGLAGRVQSRIASDGNSTRFEASVPGAARLASPAVFDTRGRLLGIAPSDRRIGGGDVSVIGAPFLSLFLDSRSIGWTTGSWQTRPGSAEAVVAAVRDNVIRVRCQSGVPAPDPIPPAPSLGAERAAADFITAYFDAFSTPSADALRALRPRYGSNVVYFGLIQSRDTVIEDKSRFFASWPYRHYALRPGLLDLSCRTGLCEATGEVTFIDHAPGRDALNQGVASFRFLIDTQSGMILEESSQLLTRGPVDTAALVATWVDRAYACRGDRSACAARDYTEVILAARDLCVRARNAQPSAADIGPCAATPAPASGLRREAEGSAEFVNGAQVVEVADFGLLSLPAQGVLEVQVEGQIRNFDPGTPGVARFSLVVGDTELPFETEVALPNGQQTAYDLSQRITLSRVDLPVGTVPVRVIFRTNRRSIHTSHDSFAELELRP